MHGVVQRRPGLLGVHAPTLQAQQGSHGLQIVLHTVMDFPDGGVLGDQLAFPLAHRGHVTTQQQRSSRLIVHGQRQVAQPDGCLVVLIGELSGFRERGHRGQFRLNRAQLRRNRM